MGEQIQSKEEPGMENFVSVEAKVFAKAMKVANAIIEVRNTIPILSAVRLRYGPAGLFIDATDLDLQASISVDEIDGSGEWMVCIAARELASVASAAGTTPLRITPASRTLDAGKERERTEKFVTIEAGDATYTLQAQLDPADYPELAGEQMQRIDRFTNGQFALMLSKVAHCISTEETRYYLNGVNWSAKPQGKRFTATDGHRLATYRYAANEHDEGFSYIIPRKTVSFLTAVMGGADVDIFSVGKGNAISDTLLDFKAPGISLRTKLIDGNYPDFDRVIPQGHNHSISVRRDEMITAIRQATAIGGYRGAAIRLHGVDGRLNIETKNLDDGTAKVTTSATWPAGMSEIGVNSRYMTEMVRNCQGEISFGVTDKGAPMTLTDDDKDMTRVVMPMRV